MPLELPLTQSPVVVVAAALARYRLQLAVQLIIQSGRQMQSIAAPELAEDQTKTCRTKRQTVHPAVDAVAVLVAVVMIAEERWEQAFDPKEEGGEEDQS